ncbi:MAG TPA: 6-phosphofructokinase [Dehalococcoidia bacterium]|nr:6-phosphofructokinase [Dehalococcoidia bacterium]
MRRIGVLTSGGDAPGMNACIRAVTRRALWHGLEVVGFRHGFCGLHDSDFEPLTMRSVGNIIQRGGTVLGSARCWEFHDAAVRERSASLCRESAVDALVIIGGDGSFYGANLLHNESGLPVLGVPATIDNDIYGTVYTIGFDTAVNTALDAIDRIRDTAQSFERVFFIEVMGRRSGHIAVDVGLAGGADDILIPERPTDIDALVQHLRDREKQSTMVVVSEGKEEGGAFEIARRVGEHLQREYRVVILGHIQRGGSPSARDRVLASMLGAEAVDALMDGYDCHMVGSSAGKMVRLPLPEAWEGRKEIAPSVIDLIRVLAS